MRATGSRVILSAVVRVARLVCVRALLVAGAAVLAAGSSPASAAGDRGPQPRPLDTPPLYSLTVVLGGDQQGSVSASAPVSSGETGISCGSQCTEVFTYPTSLILQATPMSGYQFTGWTGGGCSGTGPCSAKIDGNVTITATFAPAVAESTPVLVALALVGDGSVILESNGNPVTSCPGMCGLPEMVAGVYSAAPASGWVFSGWSGVCTGAGMCMLAAGATGSLTATFILAGSSSQPATPTPVITKATIKLSAATFHFAAPAQGVQLECALVRHVAHTVQPKLNYAACGLTKTYHDLHKGRYTLHVRAVAANGPASTTLAHSFEIS